MRYIKLQLTILAVKKREIFAIIIIISAENDESMLIVNCNSNIYGSQTHYFHRNNCLLIELESQVIKTQL